MNTADKTTTWKDVRCVCLPLEYLRDLADLRGRTEIRVTLDGRRAWVWWPAESDVVAELWREDHADRGVELFTEREGQWYRLGEHLPVFGVPIADEATGVPLDRVIIPGKLAAERPEETRGQPLLVRLVRDRNQEARPATGLRCGLRVLVVWAEQATSAQLSQLQAAWRGAGQGAAGDAEAIVLGSPRALPLLSESVRHWGSDLLVPLGYRPDPDLPEPALRRIVGAGPADLVVLDEDGFELIGREAFRPLTRAGVRLALESSNRSVPGQGNRT